MGRLIEFYRKHTYSYKKLCCHINSLFSSPHPLDFNMLLLFSTKNVKQGRKLKLTYLYACWIMHAYEALLAKVSRKAFNVGEVWNLVCCHSNKTVKLILWSTFCRILLQRIKHLWFNLAEISFHPSWLKFGWVYDVIYWLICIFLKTWISLEWKEILENSKQHFAFHTG